MQKTLWSLALGALIAAGGAIPASAQQGSGPPADRGGMMQQHGGPGGPGGPKEDGRPGMMGQGQGMMMGQGRGPMHGGGRHGGKDHGMGGPGMMAMMMILMDENADRAVSLEEFQAAHARIFKYADADNDGKLTTAEMRGFFRGLHGGDDDNDD